MIRIIPYIQQRLSLRLGLFILLVVGGVFSVSLTILFNKSKQQVRQEAVSRATQSLDETMLHISAIMDQTEEATAEMESIIQQHLQPDSLLAYSRRMLEQHPDILGFTIALMPDYFPQYGRHFSAYSLRQGDSIITVIEKHEYFEQEWYKQPWQQKRAIWMEPYIDNTPGILTTSEYNYSYVKPLCDIDGEPVGVLCTDLLLKWLSQAITTVEAYPNSSAIMLGHDGRYIVHPDTAKLVRETIFSDPDPQARKDVIGLGHAMLEGQSGIWQMIVEGTPPTCSTDHWNVQDGVLLSSVPTVISSVVITVCYILSGPSLSCHSCCCSSSVIRLSAMPSPHSINLPFQYSISQMDISMKPYPTATVLTR